MFALWGTRPTPKGHASFAHTFEAVSRAAGGLPRSGSAVRTAGVSRELVGAKEQNKIAKQIGEITFGEFFFCNCCQRQIHCYDT